MSLQQHLVNAGFGSALVYVACAACVAEVDTAAPEAKPGVVRQALSCTGKPAALPGTIDIYVAPGGSSAPTGGCGKPFATLQEAHDRIADPTNTDDPATSDYRVWVRGGVYEDESFDWTTFDLSGVHKISIESYPGEVATFDGLLGKNKFVNFKRADDPAGIDATNPPVNLGFRRIHVTNYRKWAIGIYRLGEVTIENSWFTNIGNRWAGVDAGLAVLHMGDADNCTIKNNVFSHIENVRESDVPARVAQWVPQDEDDEPPKPSDIYLIHVAYIHNDSDGNTFENNYVEHCSGDPFKTRNESDENKFLSNFTLWSGHRAFLNTHRNDAEDDDDEVNEFSSERNVLADNVALFPHPEFLAEDHPVNDLSWCTFPDCAHVTNASAASTPYMDSTGYLYPFIPDYEDVTSATQADIDNDGVDELFVAFSYPGHAGFVSDDLDGNVVFPAIPGLSLVLRTEGNEDRVLRKLVYKSDYWTQIPAIAGGDFISGGAKEVITAFQTPSETRIYRGSGVSSLTNQATLYTNTDIPPTRVTALAGGNFKTATAGDEFAVAIKNADDTETLWRGSKTTAQAAQLWTNTAAQWTGYHVGALAAVNPDSTTVQEVAASLHSSSATYLLWDVTTEFASQVYSDTSGSLWRVRSLVSTPDSGFDELYAGMEYWNVGRTYYFSDLLSGGVIHQIYSSEASESDRYWDTPAMTVRKIRSCREVVSILSGGDGDTTRVSAGDKNSIVAFGNYYRASLTPATDAEEDTTQLTRRSRGDTIADRIDCPPL